MEGEVGEVAITPAVVAVDEDGVGRGGGEEEGGHRTLDLGAGGRVEAEPQLLQGATSAIVMVKVIPVFIFHSVPTPPFIFLHCT